MFRNKIKSRVEQKWPPTFFIPTFSFLVVFPEINEKNKLYMLASDVFNMFYHASLAFDVFSSLYSVRMSLRFSLRIYLRFSIRISHTFLVGLPLYFPLEVLAIGFKSRVIQIWPPTFSFPTFSFLVHKIELYRNGLRLFFFQLLFLLRKTVVEGIVMKMRSHKHII